MNKLNRTNKSELIELAKTSTASAIAFKNNIRSEVVYYIFKKHNIQHLLKYSPRFISAFHRKGGLSNDQICVELGITYDHLYSVATSKKVTKCRFEKANELCIALNYKGSIDYMEKNGANEFRRNITSQLR
jgi:hypothetical protein